MILCVCQFYNTRVYLPGFTQYLGADKSLARPGRKQSRKHVRYAHDIRDASCHQVSFPAKQGAEVNSRHSDRNISLFPSWSS